MGQPPDLLQSGPPDPVARWGVGKEKIDTPEGRAIYSRRLGTVEPVFAHIAAHKRMDRSTLRGTVKVNIQWKLYCLVHNLEKVSRYGFGKN